jgi:hypothetical protein
MKKIFLVVLFVSTYSFSSAQTKTIWTCPMHPQIQKSGPGSCPICGMTLVKKTIKVAKSELRRAAKEIGNTDFVRIWLGQSINKYSGRRTDEILKS